MWGKREILRSARGAFLVSKRAQAADGSALIVVLWVVGLLSILVSSMAFDAHVEARLTAYSRRRLHAYYLAKSGIEVAERLMADSAGKEADDFAEDPEDVFSDTVERLADGLAVNGLQIELGEGTLSLWIEPEPSRRNVNLLKEQDWERILDLAGVPEDRWPVLIESFLDWLDKDDTPRFDGAETEDYYATLDPPYRAKNGPLDTVEELLLIRGFSPALLWGGEMELEFSEPVAVQGIADLLTTYGDGKVNINAASARVMRTLEGVDEIAAGAIIEEREGLWREDGTQESAPFLNAQDLMRRIPGLSPGIQNHLTTDSRIFRITAVGTVGGVSRRVWGIVEYKGKELTILRWREED